MDRDLRMTLTPLADHIIVKQDLSPEKSAGGIILPVREELAQGVVIAIGPGVEEVSIGERVMYSPHAGQKFMTDDGELTVIEFQDLFGVLRPA